MSLNTDFIGRTYRTDSAYLVGREKVREFADAIGDKNPLYHDVDAAKTAGHPDLIAPPTFPFVITFKAMVGAIGHPSLNLDYGRVVHGEELFSYQRPLYAGDEVIVESTIVDISAVGKNELLALRQDVKTVKGELIVSTTNVTVSRGTAPETSEA